MLELSSFFGSTNTWLDVIGILETDVSEWCKEKKVGEEVEDVL